MADKIIGKGNNIKCYDKIKISHVLTGQILHACNFQWRSGSNNQAVTCHRAPDDSDWFVPIRPEQPECSYHFKYKDEIVLCNSQSNKFLHVSHDFQSIVSKRLEISLKELGARKDQGQWLVEPAQETTDQFWRVGELIKLKNKGTSAYIGSHKRKIKTNDEYEVFGDKHHQSKKNLKKQQDNESPKHKKEANIKEQTQVVDEYLWRVIEVVPFIYTPPITDKKKPKTNPEQQQLARLIKMRNSFPQKPVEKVNEITQILKSESRRLEQVQIQKQKLEQETPKQSCWRKICCCLCIQPEGYNKIN